MTQLDRNGTGGMHPGMDGIDQDGTGGTKRGAREQDGTGGIDWAGTQTRRMVVFPGFLVLSLLFPII